MCVIRGIIRDLQVAYRGTAVVGICDGIGQRFAGQRLGLINLFCDFEAAGRGTGDINQVGALVAF